MTTENLREALAWLSGRLTINDSTERERARTILAHIEDQDTELQSLRDKVKRLTDDRSELTKQATSLSVMADVMGEKIEDQGAKLVAFRAKVTELEGERDHFGKECHVLANRLDKSRLMETFASGVLCDAGDIPVGNSPTEYRDGLGMLLGQRDALRVKLAQLQSKYLAALRDNVNTARSIAEIMAACEVAEDEAERCDGQIVYAAVGDNTVERIMDAYCKLK